MDEAAHNRIRKSFAAQTMMRTLGAEIAEILPGQITITAPILPGARQQQGYGHAGLTFSVGDSAAGYAALSLLPLDFEVVTAEMKVNLLAPARGARLVATGKVVRSGRRLCIVTSEVHAEDGGESSLIAILQGTMVPVSI